jgi:hypothetical protein
MQRDEQPTVIVGADGEVQDVVYYFGYHGTNFGVAKVNIRLQGGGTGDASNAFIRIQESPRWTPDHGETADLRWQAIDRLQPIPKPSGNK